MDDADQGVAHEPGARSRAGYPRRVGGEAPDAGAVRLAEVVALLSLGTDLGLGQPMEHMIRACLIAVWADRPGGGPAPPDRPRNVEQDVARELVISARTAGTHVEHIYTKIGASNRAQASLFAMKHGLMSEWSAAGLAPPPG